MFHALTVCLSSHDLPDVCSALGSQACGSLQNPDACLIAFCQLLVHHYKKTLQSKIQVHLDPEKTAALDPVKVTGVLTLQSLCLVHRSPAGVATRLEDMVQDHQQGSRRLKSQYAGFKPFLQLVFGNTVDWEGESDCVIL